MVWLVLLGVLALSLACALFAGEFLDETAARKLGPMKGPRR